MRSGWTTLRLSPHHRQLVVRTQWHWLVTYFDLYPTGTSQSVPPASSSSTAVTDSSLLHSESPLTSTVPPTGTSSSSTTPADSSLPHLQSSLTGTIPPTGTNTLPSRKNTLSSTLPTGVIVGFVVGGALVVALVIAAIVLFRTSKKKGKVSKGTYSSFTALLSAKWQQIYPYDITFLRQREQYCSRTATTRAWE